MAKSYIINVLGTVTLHSYLPCTPANAETICADLLEGTYAVYEATTEVGSDNGVTLAYDANVQFRNSGTGQRNYLKMIVKSTVSPDDIQTALKGLTINGILIDEVVVLRYAPLTFA